MWYICGLELITVITCDSCYLGCHGFQVHEALDFSQVVTELLIE